MFIAEVDIAPEDYYKLADVEKSAVGTGRINFMAIGLRKLMWHVDTTAVAIRDDH